MPSPFPGMDPYLEVQPRWEIFHGWFIRELARLSLPQAAGVGCWIDVERDVYGEDSAGDKVLIGEADEVFTVAADQAVWSGTGAPLGVLAVPRVTRQVVADPRRLRRHRQHYLVVRHNRQWPRALAVVELLSPANKRGSYARTYNTKRAKMLASRTHFMEIDLLRGGRNPLRGTFPGLEPTPYFVFVARKTAAGRDEEGYPIRLPEPLPTVGLPLGDGRPDLPLELAAAFQSAYDLTTGGRPIAYTAEPVPEPPLTPDEAAWAASLTGTIR